MVQRKLIRLVTMRLWVQFLALLSGLRIRCCRELWCRLQTRLGSRIAVALACRLVATAPIRPLAWEPPRAAGVALKGQKQKPWRALRSDPPLKKSPRPEGVNVTLKGSVQGA